MADEVSRPIEETEAGPGARPAPGGGEVRSQPRPRPRRWPRLAASLVLLVATGGGVAGYWAWSLFHVRTSNAYVEGNITPVSSEIGGKVVALFTDDNMIVKAGDPIAQIDPVPFQLEVDQEAADLRRLEAEARAAEVNVRLVRRDRKAQLDGAIARRGEAERKKKAAEVVIATRERIHEKERELLASQEARLPGLVALARNARDYYDRFSRLAASGDIPVQDRDNRESTYRESVATYEALRSDIAAAQRQVLASAMQLQESRVLLEQADEALNNAASAVAQAEAAQLQPDIAGAELQALESRVRQAEARLRTARLNLSYCLIRAPQGGIVSRRTIQLGEILAARQPFLRIVPLDLDDVWVVANLREDQMQRVRVGNPVAVSLDGIPGRTFRGWVESVAGGTGSVFSLFPPDNATGNFVRVVQRLPVRIRFDERENYENRIRPGMSSVVRIDDSRVVRRGRHAW